VHAAPRVFVSYAYDSPAHRTDVHRLSELLRISGVDVRLDDYDTGERHDWSAWMIDQITNADYVIVVGSPAYRKAGDGGGPASRNRGVQHEAAVLRDRLYADRPTWTRKLLPVVLPGNTLDDIPLFLLPYVGSHYNVPELTSSGIEALLRAITGQPAHPAPSLGPVPTLGARTGTGPTRTGLPVRSRKTWLAIAATAVPVLVLVGVVLARWAASGPPAAAGPPATTTGNPPTTTSAITTTSSPAPPTTTTAVVRVRWQGTLQLGGYGGPGGGWFLDYVPPTPAVTGDVFYSNLNEIDSNNSIVAWNQQQAPTENQCATLLNTQLGHHTFDAVDGNSACFSTNDNRVGFLTVTATSGPNDLNPTISVSALVWQKP